ncbi:hypothetical protein SAMN05660199_01936 [Klenkia soli]|uniref:Uncharacterized protein n=1 Tax=Klenkia soli TaxID=1052260 RepID=A0A1H0JCF2_9ACTN|nr:hypothetical protein [Klenkia soli]SDO41428.1 hypothetical protein SAMN05660199_01936 [Klenkia soli]
MAEDGDGDGDPFVRQLAWLVDRAGGKEALVRASGNRVGLRTLDTWSRGGYPRTSVSGAVRDLDAWALAQDFGYPDAAGAPRLVSSCGTARVVPPPVVAGGQPTGVPTVHRARRWWALAAAQVAVVAGTVAVTLAVVDGGTGAPAAAGASAAPTVAVPGLLPSQGDGEPRPQTVGADGVNTFADPRGLTVGGGAVPAGTVVDVRCRIAAAPMPSAGLDGWWYLVDSGPWAGLWAAADGFVGGRSPGDDGGYPTDLDVPVCTAAFTWSPGR